VRSRSSGTHRPTAQLTRSQRRQRQRRRRARVALACTIAACVLALISWFPMAALDSQHRALAAASTRLAQVQSENRALAAEERRLSTPSEVERIARDKYQLAMPGVRSFTVLPPNGTRAGQYAGDPGYQPPVSPAAASELPPGATGSGPPSTARTTARSGSLSASAHAAGTAHAPAPPDGLLARIEHALEFWR